MGALEVAAARSTCLLVFVSISVNSCLTSAGGIQLGSAFNGLALSLSLSLSGIMKLSSEDWEQEILLFRF